MFSTLKSRSGEKTLQQVRHSSRPPLPAGEHQRLACSACRQKKVRCTGEQPSCQRCDGQGIRCKYMRSRHRARGQAEELGSRDTSSASSSASRQDRAGRAGSASVTTMERRRQSAPDTDQAGSSSGGGDKSTGSSQVDRMSNFSALASSTDASVSGNPSDGLWSDPMLSLDGDSVDPFTMDPFLLLPPPTDGIDNTVQTSAQDVFPWTAPQNPSTSSNSTSSSKPPNQPTPMRRRPITSCEHDCFSSALHSLEVVYSLPHDRAISPREVLCFIGTYDRRCIQNLSQIYQCPTCTGRRQFLLLLVTVLDKSVEALARIGQILTDQNFLVTDTGLDSYGVDSVEDFVSMYTPILAPARFSLERMVEDLLARFDEEASLPHQLLRQLLERLQRLDADLSGQILERDA